MAQFMISKKICEKIAEVGEDCYLRVAIRNGAALISIGATSESGLVEKLIKSAADGEEPVMVNFSAEEFRTAVGAAEMDVPVSVEDGILTVNNLVMNEIAAPAFSPKHEEAMRGKNLYTGEARGIPADAAALVGKDVCELFDGAVQINTAPEGTAILGTNGLRVVKAFVSKPESGEDLSEEEVAALDQAFANGMSMADGSGEIPFAGSKPVEKAEKTAKKEKKEKGEKKQVEEAFTTQIVLKLEEGEKAAFVVSPKSFSIALENLSAVANGASVLLLLNGEGSELVGLQAYKAPVQAKFIAGVKAVAGEKMMVSVDLDSLNGLVKSLVGIEDEIHVGIFESRVRIGGSETRFFLPIVETPAMLSEEPDDGVPVALYPSSLSAALRSSVCLARDSKGTNTALEDLLFTVTEEGRKICVYSCDGYSASRAQIKGVTSGNPEDSRFIVPGILRNIRWPEGENEKPVQFNFGSKLLAISMPGRQYIFRYNGGKYINVEGMMNPPTGTVVTLNAEEAKQRIGVLVGSMLRDSKKPVILTVEGSNVRASLEESNIAIGVYGRTVGDSVRVGFDPKLFLRSIGAFAPDENFFLSISDPKKPFYMVNKDGTLTVLQMTLKLND